MAVCSLSVNSLEHLESSLLKHSVEKCPFVMSQTDSDTATL